MKAKPSISKYDQQSLMLINSKGRLRRLNTPFRVECIKPIHKIHHQHTVYVTCINEHPSEKLLYRVLNEWIPYHHFQLITYY